MNLDLPHYPTPKSKLRSTTIAWSKNPQWTDLLISAIVNNDALRTGHFTDGTQSQWSSNKTSMTKQYEHLASVVFSADPEMAQDFAQEPSRFAVSVSGHLNYLKKQYQGFQNSIGLPGAAMRPEEAPPGSELQNQIVVFTRSFPWYADLHSIWIQNPKFNPAAFPESTPQSSGEGSSTAHDDDEDGEQNSPHPRVRVPVTPSASAPPLHRQAPKRKAAGSPAPDPASKRLSIARNINLVDRFEDVTRRVSDVSANTQLAHATVTRLAEIQAQVDRDAAELAARERSEIRRIAADAEARASQFQHNKEMQELELEKLRIMQGQVEG